MARWFWSEGGGKYPTDAYVREIAELQPSLERGWSGASSFVSVAGDEPEYDDLFAATLCEKIRLKYSKARETLCEQVRLKYFKAKLLAWSICQSGCGLASCLPCPCCRPPPPPKPPAPPPEDGHWLGKTMQKIENPAEVSWWSAAQGPSWRVGNAKDLEAREVTFARTGKKGPAAASLPFAEGSMYECISCDAIRSTQKIEEIVGKLVEISDLPSSGTHDWYETCPLPRIICINLMVPYTREAADPGCSYVVFFHIKPEVVDELRNHGHARYKCIRMFSDFCSQPAGTPSDLHHPDRNLNSRREKHAAIRKVNRVPGLFKAAAYCENLQDLPLPFLMRKTLPQFNGKPALITNSGYIVKAKSGAGPPGEWIEVGIDIRRFNDFAQKQMHKWRGSHLALAAIHFGFVIQAVGDEDLPEGLVCDFHVCGVDMNEGVRRLRA